MSEPTSTTLDELERVTREYARYWRGGGWAICVGAVVAGVDALLGLLHLSKDWVPIETVLGTAVWLWALRLSRRWYQRRGAVVAMPARRGGGFPLAMLYVLVACQAALLCLVDHAFSRGPLFLSAWVATILVLPGLFPLAASAIRGNPEASYTLVPFVAPAWSTAGSTASLSARAMGLVGSVTVLAIAVVMLAIGIQRHRAFRRLQRRIETLRGSLPMIGPEGEPA